jgi:cytochrome c-type biogenesis protein CcmH/NrfF
MDMRVHSTSSIPSFHFFLLLSPPTLTDTWLLWVTQHICHVPVETYVRVLELRTL